MKVVFLDDVPDVARAGEVKEVANGYARNFLIPKGLATPATKQALQRVEALRQASAKREAKALEEAQALAQRLEGLSLNFKARVGEQGRLYGSITSADIAEEIEKAVGQAIDRRRIELEQPLREVGSFPVSLRLAREVTAQVIVNIEAESSD